MFQNLMSLVFILEKKSMNKLFLLLTLLSIVGCSSLKVSPRGCKNEGLWGKETGVYEDKIEKSYFAVFIDREVNLKDIVDCKNLSEIKIEIERSFLFHYKVKINFREE